MLKFVGTKLSQRLVAAFTDEVVGAMPIPQGGSVTQIDLDFKLISPAGVALGMEKCVMYGIDVYVVPIPDPDSSITFESAWDRFVPKEDVITVGLNLDTTTEDASPVFVEGGSVDINALFDMTGLAPKRIFRRRRMLSFADIGSVVGAQAVDTWTPSESFHTTIKRNVRVNQPSYVLVGFSSPGLAGTTTTVWPPPASEAEWAILQYMEKFLEDAFVMSLGMIETGAESPYEEAELFIGRLLEDAILEETAGAFHPQIWNVFCRSTYQLTVPGRLNMGNKVLTADMG